ncbi:MAG: endonuclease III, partial [bacterium]|nr:endonuclease III [bacterium]
GIEKPLQILANYYPKTAPMFKAQQGDPFKTLIATLMSARTRDSVTVNIAYELFKIASTPDQILKMGETNLAEKIKGVNFYKTKAKAIINLCTILLEDFNGKVPDTEKELITLPGVGVKTARVYLNEALGKKVIAVDVHVNRIPNRMGYLDTKTPEQTQIELEKIVPENLKGDTNRALVYHGQNICLPKNPKCEICPVYKYCDFGITKLGKDFNPKVTQKIKLQVGEY